MPQDPSVQKSSAISFGTRIATSGRFKTLFKDGMALVEDAATYLDGVGREEATRLPRVAALAYASESLRLTTRLMQIASWLLLQRAVNEGEITAADAASDKRRTRIAWQDMSSAAASLDALPQALQTLIDTSLQLQGRIICLDRMTSEPEKPARSAVEQSPLEAQMVRLREAFGAGSTASDTRSEPALVPSTTPVISAV